MSKNVGPAHAAIRVRVDARKEQMLAAALELSELLGYAKVTREDIARKIECAPALIPYHFGTMTNLRRDIMRAAIRKPSLPVIAQGLAANDPHARKAPDALKRAAVESITV